jgi:hypothetical protein
MANGEWTDRDGRWSFDAFFCGKRKEKWNFEFDALFWREERWNIKFDTLFRREESPSRIQADSTREAREEGI